MQFDSQPQKKHGRGKKAQALADDPRPLVEQFSEKLRKLLIGGNEENRFDLRAGFYEKKYTSLMCDPYNMVSINYYLPGTQKVSIYAASDRLVKMKLTMLA